MDVGIRELKARLSEYVDRAARGEVVRVTDRGEPRAVLMPLPRADEVDRGLAEGWITRALDELPQPVRPVDAPWSTRMASLLDDDRGD